MFSSLPFLLSYFFATLLQFKVIVSYSGDQKYEKKKLVPFSQWQPFLYLKTAIVSLSLPFSPLKNLIIPVFLDRCSFQLLCIGLLRGLHLPSNNGLQKLYV